MNWDDAIVEAERQLKQAQQRVKQLRCSIRTFERLRDSGFPFPDPSTAKPAAEPPARAAAPGDNP